MNNKTQTTASTLSALANSFMPSSSSSAQHTIQDTILNQINSDAFNNFITYASFNVNPSLSSSSSSRSSSSSCSTNSFVENIMMTPLPPLFDDGLVKTINSQTNTKRTKLFVGNLSSDTTLEELIELFGRYGVVNEKLCVVKDDNYAFIHFFSERSADEACQNLNDSFFKNRYIRVQYSTSQGHIKKTLNTTRLSNQSDANQMARSSSAMFLNEALLAKYLPSMMTMKTMMTQVAPLNSFCLTNDQLKSNLLVPTTFLKSLESHGEFSLAPKRHALTSSQSVQSFGSVGAGRPILKAKYV